MSAAAGAAGSPRAEVSMGALLASCAAATAVSTPPARDPAPRAAGDDGEGQEPQPAAAEPEAA